MRHKFYIVWLVMLLLATTFTGAVSAQDDNLLDTYSDITQSRAEDGAFVLGDPNAPITIIEFTDFLCGHCQNYETTIAEFIDEYVATGQVKFELRIIPVVNEYYSPLLAQIAECTYDEGLFWPAHHLLFDMAINHEISENIVEDVAERLGLDVNVLYECLPNAQQHVVDNILANDLGVTGTPAVRVQVGDGPRGAVQIEGMVFASGGLPMDALDQFITSENPDEMIKLMKRLLDDNLLHDDSLLTNEPCATPCWGNITPGETSWEDALELLGNNDDVSGTEIEQSEDNTSARVIWAQGNGYLCCQMVTQDGETVSLFWLRLAPGITLGELIEVHGEPDYLIGYRYTSDQSYFSIFYPEVPMVIFVYVDGVDGALSETSEIFGAQYLTNNTMAYMLGSNPLHAWEGYQSFDDYMNGEFELTPG